MIIIFFLKDKGDDVFNASDSETLAASLSQGSPDTRTSSALESEISRTV